MEKELVEEVSRTAYRPIGVQLFLEIPEASINDGTGGLAVLCTLGHQASIHGVGDFGRAGHKDDGTLWHGINLIVSPFVSGQGFFFLSLECNFSDEVCTYVVSRVFGRRVLVQRVFNRVSRTDNLGVSRLTVRRPHGDAGEEAAVGELELAERIADIAA